MLVLYSHPECHLCHRLEVLLAAHLARLNLELEHRNIRTDKAWFVAYHQRVPVLAWNDRVILEGNPTPEEVDRAMRALSR